MSGPSVPPSDDPRDLVCFASSFSHEGADNITHATLDGQRTLCGRTGWETSERWSHHGPDCLRCARSLKMIMAKRVEDERPERLVASLQAVIERWNNEHWMAGWTVPEAVARCERDVRAALAEYEIGDDQQ